MEPVSTRPRREPAMTDRSVDTRQVEPCARHVPQAPGLLEVRVSEPRPGMLVVAPTGEVDLSTATLFRDAGLAAVAEARSRVVVDLSGLTFCGSTGLVVLMETKQQADAAGVEFRTAGMSRSVQRVLEITGLGPALAHRRTLAEALEAVGS
jgi:anti-anti-sigma factor